MPDVGNNQAILYTVDDIHPAVPKDPKLWELWCIPYYGE